MPENHDRAPIVEAIQSYQQTITPFTIPGHKLLRRLNMGPKSVEEGAFRYDVLELAGFDDIHKSKGVRDEAQKLAAELYSADQCFFSTGGSTLAAQVVAMTLSWPGDKLLVARNCHKSLVSGMIMSGANPVYIQPEFDDELDVSHGLTPESVKAALEENPDAKAVIAVSPSYYGVAIDVKGIAVVCHAAGVPLVIDEAWGSHFDLHPDLPRSGMVEGADLTFMSLHKSELALCQGSVICVKGDRIDTKRLESIDETLRSTSESGLILASIDASRRMMATQGRQLMDKALKLANAARREIGAMGIYVLGEEVLAKPGAFALDKTKLVMDLRSLGLSGVKAADWLRDEKGLTFELADHRRLMAIVTCGDHEGSMECLIDGMRDLVSASQNELHSGNEFVPPLSTLVTECVMPPREAYLGKTKEVPLAASAGEVSAEILSPYPPGIPILTPGERITEPLVRYMERVMEIGMTVPDAYDQSLQTIKVVA